MDVRQYGPQIFPPYGSGRVKVFPRLSELEREKPRPKDDDRSEKAAPSSAGEEKGE